MKCGPLKAQNNAGTVTFMFESQNHEKVSDNEMNLMNLNEFARICRDLAQFSESMVIDAQTKVSAYGAVRSANIKFRPAVSVKRKRRS